MNNTLFSRVIIVPNHRLEPVIREHGGQSTISFYLTKENNGYAIWKECIVWKYNHDEDPDKTIRLMRFETNTHTSKDDLIIETYDVYLKELKQIEGENL